MDETEGPNNADFYWQRLGGRKGKKEGTWIVSNATQTNLNPLKNTT